MRGLRADFSLKANLGAWLLFGLLVLVELFNWHHEHDLIRACELSGPHPISYGNPQSPREELDTLCSSYSLDDN